MKLSLSALVLVAAFAAYAGPSAEKTPSASIQDDFERGRTTTGERPIGTINDELGTERRDVWTPPAPIVVIPENNDRRAVNAREAKGPTRRSAGAARRSE